MVSTVSAVSMMSTVSAVSMLSTVSAVPTVSSCSACCVYGVDSVCLLCLYIYAYCIYLHIYTGSGNDTGDLGKNIIKGECAKDVTTHIVAPKTLAAAGA